MFFDETLQAVGRLLVSILHYAYSSDQFVEMESAQKVLRQFHLYPHLDEVMVNAALQSIA